MGKVYQLIGKYYDFATNETLKEETRQTYEEKLEDIMKDHMPSGSGFNAGTKLILEESKPDQRLVFKAPFHHMNYNGYYDGWTEHKIIVTPSFAYGFEIAKVTGRNRNDIKAFIYDRFLHALNADLD